MTPPGSAWPSERLVIALLVSGSHAHVRRFARTLCSTPEDAEEAAQEALMVLYRKIGTLRVAAALGLSRAAMKSRLHRGRETLRIQLQDR